MSQTFINTWLRPEIKALTAYPVPDSTGFIKLDAMENPYDLADDADLFARHQTALSQASINRYPDPSAKILSKTLKKHMNIAPDCDILLGNGSDELIQLLCMACSSNEVIMSPAPSFVMYPMIAKFTHLQHIALPLDEQFELQTQACLDLIKQHNPKLIFIAYPNNPTGNLFDKNDLITLIKNTNALVVIDEAYYAYAKADFLSELAEFDNLVVMRTVSKVGLAGLRLGLLIGKTDIIAQFNKIRLPYNINSLTQISANFLLENFATLQRQTDTIIQQRAQLFSQLSEISAIKTYHTQANFILFHTPNAQGLFEYLLSQKILIKNLSKQPRLINCLRVTVGKPAENKIFITAVKDYYAQS